MVDECKHRSWSYFLFHIYPATAIRIHLAQSRVYTPQTLYLITKEGSRREKGQTRCDNGRFLQGLLFSISIRSLTRLLLTLLPALLYWLSCSPPFPCKSMSSITITCTSFISGEVSSRVWGTPVARIESGWSQLVLMASTTAACSKHSLDVEVWISVLYSLPFVRCTIVVVHQPQRQRWPYRRGCPVAFQHSLTDLSATHFEFLLKVVLVYPYYSHNENSSRP